MAVFCNVGRICILVLIAHTFITTYAAGADKDTKRLLKGVSSQRSRSNMSKHAKISIDDTSSFHILAEMIGLGPLNSFRLAEGAHSIPPSAKGIKRVRLLQTYGGYDVFGASVEAEVDLEGNFTGQFTGTVVWDLESQIPDPEACRRPSELVLNWAIRLVDLKPNDELIDRERKPIRLVFAKPEMAQARIAYKVELLYGGDEQITRPVFFFDACTRDLLLEYDWMGMKSGLSKINEEHDDNLDKPFEMPGVRLPSNIARSKRAASDCPVSAVGVGGNPKMGKITYNSAPFCLNVKKESSSTCKMEGTYVKVIDNEYTRYKNRVNVITFDCDTGYIDPINGGYGIANDAFYHGEMSARFLVEIYGYRPFSYIPRLVVHYNKRYENAFWNGQDMYFGDGYRNYYPFVDIDTVAHEMAHAVVEFNSGLVYTEEPGAINEAFADIMGETAKFFMRKSNDWLISYDTWKSTTGRIAQRFFEDPPLDGVSIKHVDDYYSRIDVHYSSGIFNHAFYVMVKEEGMTIYDAFECFFDANRNLWQTFTGFSDGACHVMQAAYDNGFDHTKVKVAFKKVGISLDACSISELTTIVLRGETRNQILVGPTRSPVLKIDFETSSKVTLLVDNSAGEGQFVQLKVGQDESVTTVVISGLKTVEFEPKGYSHVYVQLSTQSTSQLSVSLTVS